MSTPYGALFNIAKAQPLDNNGLTQAACYLNFYITGTTTPLAVYSNATLATPISQPVTADSSGRFVPIYLDPSKVYRYQLYNAANVLLQDVDPYLPGVANITNTTGSFLAPSTTAAAVIVNAPASGRAVIQGIDNASGNWFLGANKAANDLVTGSGAQDLIIQTPNNIVLDPTSGGTIKGMGPVATALVDMTPDTGTFTLTPTGFSGSTTPATVTATWARVGKLVMVNVPGLTGTSNATTFTLTGLPSAIQAPTTPQNATSAAGIDNNASCVLAVGVTNTGTLTLGKQGATGVFSSSGWTNTSTKGFQALLLTWLLI